MHFELCEDHEEKTTSLPKKCGQIFFKNYKNSQIHLFVIYGDFECFNEKTMQRFGKASEKLAIH